MADKVDVLAVMDRADERLHNTCAVMGENRFVCEAMRAARNEVADLMDQAEAMRLVLIKIANGASGNRGRDKWMADQARAALEGAV